jgi:hypothetical protein
MALLQFALVFGNDHFVLPVPVPVGAVSRRHTCSSPTRSA